MQILIPRCRFPTDGAKFGGRNLGGTSELTARRDADRAVDGLILAVVIDKNLANHRLAGFSRVSQQNRATTFETVSGLRSAILP